MYLIVVLICRYGHRGEWRGQGLIILIVCAIPPSLPPLSATPISQCPPCCHLSCMVIIPSIIVLKSCPRHRRFHLAPPLSWLIVVWLSRPHFSTAATTSFYTCSLPPPLPLSAADCCFSPLPLPLSSLLSLVAGIVTLHQPPPACLCRPRQWLVVVYLADGGGGAIICPSSSVESSTPPSSSLDPSSSEDPLLSHGLLLCFLLSPPAAATMHVGRCCRQQ